MWSKVLTMSQSTSPNGSFGVSNLRKHSKTHTNITTSVLARYRLLDASSLSFLSPVAQKALPGGSKAHQGPQSGPQELPKMNPKVDKTEPGASRCPLGVPVHPWITKMEPRVPKMEPSGLQNHGFGCLVTPKSSTRVTKPPKENRTEQPKRKELQRTMHTI